MEVRFAGTYHIPVEDAPWYGLSCGGQYKAPFLPGLMQNIGSLQPSFMMYGAYPDTNPFGGFLFLDGSDNIVGFIINRITATGLEYYTTSASLDINLPPAGTSVFAGGCFVYGTKYVLNYAIGSTPNILNVIYGDLTEGILTTEYLNSKVYILKLRKQYAYSGVVNSINPPSIQNGSVLQNFINSNSMGDIFPFIDGTIDNSPVSTLRFFVDKEAMVSTTLSTIPFPTGSFSTFVAPGKMSHLNSLNPFVMAEYVDNNLLRTVTLNFPSFVNLGSFNTSYMWVSGRYLIMLDLSYNVTNSMRYLILDQSLRFCFYIVLNFVTVKGQQYYASSVGGNILAAGSKCPFVVDNTLVFPGLTTTIYLYPGSSTYAYQWHGIGGAPFPTFPPPPEDPFGTVANFTPNGRRRYSWPHTPRIYRRS